MKKKTEKVFFKEGVYYFRDGWKQKIGDINKVYVKGTDYERGYQLGKLLSKEIKIAFKSYLLYNISKRIEGMYFFKGALKWILFFLVKPYLFIFQQKKVEKLFKKYPDWLANILEGISRGAKIHPFFLKFVCTPKDEDAIRDNRLNQPGIKSCCSFAFTGKDGNIYHGKNLDWVKVEKHIDLICFQQHEDENGDSFSIIGVPGFFYGYEFGMNSHGISIGLTGRFHRGGQASTLVFTNALELNVLRYGKNLSQIQNMYDTKTGFNRSDGLLISSESESDYKLFEVCPMGAAITSAKNGVNWTVNTFAHPRLQKYNKNWATIYNKKFCDPRYKRLEELLSQNPQAQEDAFKILSDTLQPGFESKKFLGQASINRFISHTSALIVRSKNKENEGLWIAKARTYSASHEYSFFDFSATPQKIPRTKAADPMINKETFKNFRDLMKLRENRYNISIWKLFREAKKLIKKEPDNPIFILFLAQNYIKYNRPKQALNVLTRHSLPWCADYWYCLGQCQKRTGNYEGAKNSFTKAMTLPSIDGFDEMVKMLCLVQLVKINSTLGLKREVEPLREKIIDLQSNFATPNIGMPDYPYINNICEQLEDVVL